MTQIEQNAMQLSSQLLDITENDGVMSLIDSLVCAQTSEEKDWLCYNEPCFGEGAYQSGKVLAHHYIKCLQNVGDAVVLRIVMVSHHYELLDSEKYAVIGNMDQDEIEKIQRLEEDVDVSERYSYYEPTEVAQFWFLPTGDMVILARKNGVGDFASNLNWTNWKNDYTQEKLIRDFHLDPNGKAFSDEGITGLREDDPDYSGGWLSETPLLPCSDEGIFDVLNSGVDKSILNDSFYDVRVAVFTPDVMQAAAFTLWDVFMRNHNLYDEFTDMQRVNHPIAVALKMWNMNALWTSYIYAGMASSAAKYYHTIKIAHRNGFDASTPERQRRWMKLLDDITFCNGNIQDPRNFMPVDFEQMEAYWQQRVANKKRLMAKEAEKRRKEQEELLRLSKAERREREDLDYQQRRGIMRALVIGNDKMYARVIQDVTEFYDEGVAQGFCIYNSRYYTFPDMLCFTVRDAKTDKRLSTVTYDMRNEIIEANLTKGDQVPEMYDEIEALFMEHKDIIRELWQRCPDFIRPSESGLAAQQSAHAWNLAHRNKEQAQKDAILARRAKAAQKAAAKQQTIVIAHAI